MLKSNVAITCGTLQIILRDREIAISKKDLVNYYLYIAELNLPYSLKIIFFFSLTNANEHIRSYILRDRERQRD